MDLKTEAWQFALAIVVVLGWIAGTLYIVQATHNVDWFWLLAPLILFAM